MSRRQAAQNLAQEAVSCAAAPSQADPEAQLPDYPGNSSNQLGNLGNPGNPGNPGNQPRPSAPIDQNTADTSTTPDMTETGGTRVMGDRSDSEIDSPPSYDAALQWEEKYDILCPWEEIFATLKVKSQDLIALLPRFTAKATVDRFT